MPFRPCPTGGTITIRAANKILKENQGVPLPPGKYVTIAVQDQGIGIPPDHLPKIFDPYFSTKQTGSGLGLATSYSIVKNHDGYMTVQSQLGAGTTFHIYLPASVRKTRSVKKTPPGPPPAGKGRILVMDDDAGVRKVAVKILTHLGYEAECAVDGTEALHRYRRTLESGRPFAAVIMDLTIPGGMGGKDALQALMELDPGVRAIVSSGYADDPIMTHYREYGFRGVIKKPYRVDTFGHVLHQVLQDQGEAPGAARDSGEVPNASPSGDYPKG
jgi:two-component system cell cycle sensor histidine kinase/response regulator CckA